MKKKLKRKINKEKEKKKRRNYKWQTELKKEEMKDENLRETKKKSIKSRKVKKKAVQNKNCNFTFVFIFSADLQFTSGLNIFPHLRNIFYWKHPVLMDDNKLGDEGECEWVFMKEENDMDNWGSWKYMQGLKILCDWTNKGEIARGGEIWGRRGGE